MLQREYMRRCGNAIPWPNHYSPGQFAAHVGVGLTVACAYLENLGMMKPGNLFLKYLQQVTKLATYPSLDKQSKCGAVEG